MMTMAEALLTAAGLFREYEAHHQAQADAIDPNGGHNFQAVAKALDVKMEREKKAARNRDAADMCERTARAASYQARINRWMMECFGSEIAADQTERGDRLLEEVLELLQSKGYDFARIPQLVEYVAGRPPGDPDQELGGVSVCLFAAANAYDLDLGAAAERELARISEPETMAKIRAKQAAKPSMSPLPQ